MKKIVTVLLALTALVVASSSVYAATRYTTLLMGTEEVPSVTSSMTGTLTLNVGSGDVISYLLAIRNGVNVTASHLHCGVKGQNGPVVANLYTPTSAVSGNIVVQASDVALATTSTQCSPAISSKADLVAALGAGRIYANVHTQANPGGEIRGQLGSTSGSTTLPPTTGSGTGTGTGGLASQILQSNRQFQQSLFQSFFGR